MPTLEYVDGSVYVGDICDGKRHGRGTQYVPLISVINSVNSL